jgi:DNA-binding response OmpR family regulator
VLLVTPTGFTEEHVLATVQDALRSASFTVETHRQLRMSAASADVIVTLQGWGDLTLLETLVAVQVAFGFMPTLAIVMDNSALAPLLDAGFNDCIRWPFDAAELAARVRARSPSTDGFQTASITVDAARLTIRCNRVLMRLTPGEFRLFKQLLDAPDQWISSKALIQAHSGKARAGATPVSGRIHSIRKKLQHEAWRLRSHRTLGYLFETTCA